MQRSLARLLVSLFFSFLILPVQAAVQNVQSSAEELLAKKLQLAIPRVPITSVHESRLNGLYEVELASGERIFSDADASHFIVGDLFQVTTEGLVNLTEADRNVERAAKMASMTDDQKILFTPQVKKVSVSVFTDVDCVYCQRLHASIQDYLDRGIEIKYLAFPRAGVGSDSYNKIVSAWCADDKQEALTRLKAGQSIEEKICSHTVTDQYRLGREIGVSGTPALVLESGELIPGFVPADQLAKMLGL